MNITRHPDAFGPYRYRLTAEFTGQHRDWSNGHLVVIMCNPATVQEEQDLVAKPYGTRRRLITFARDNGYRTLTEVNLFAYRCPKPSLLARTIREHAIDPVGPENNRAIALAVSEADNLIAAWGVLPHHPIFSSRAAEVTQMLEASGKSLYCLGKNKDGSPTKPTRGRYAIQTWP